MLIILGLGLLFSLLNGVQGCSLVATVISSRALRPRQALILSALVGFSAPFIIGVAVATSIGKDLVDPNTASPQVIIAALSASILWNLISILVGIPSSTTHALVGGVVGAALAWGGLEAVEFGGLGKVLISLFLSPVIGLLAGFLITRLVLFMAKWTTPKVNWVFKRGQILTSMALAFSYGANDAQKSIGMIALGLVVTGYFSKFTIPLWVIAAGAATNALGVGFGGWRQIRTLGMKFFKIRPVDGFCAQAASALVVLGASMVGGPVSTTQVVSTSIMGVGAAERLGKVRWGVAGDFLTAWLVNIPFTGLLAAGICWLLMYFTGR